MPVSLVGQFDLALLDRVGPRTARDWVVDTVGFLDAVTFGALILLQGVHDTVHPLTGSQLVIDAVCGAICCLALWRRRRWPPGVALLCVVLGVFSAAATIAGLLALASLAVHRSVRQVLSPYRPLASEAHPWRAGRPTQTPSNQTSIETCGARPSYGRSASPRTRRCPRTAQPLDALGATPEGCWFESNRGSQKRSSLREPGAETPVSRCS
jgi:hypothetical protein